VMTLALSASADVELDEEVFLTLMVEPRLTSDYHRVTAESLRTTPIRFAQLDNDLLGNPLRRFVAPRGLFSYYFQATVDAEAPRGVTADLPAAPLCDLSPDLLHFTLPSRYCESDMLRRMALSDFGALPPGGEQVLAVARWIREHTQRLPLEGHPRAAAASAGETALRRIGGDRDRVHLLIAFCRALRIPARYVSGYYFGYDKEDFHCWAEVWLGGRWHAVDPGRERTPAAMVPIAVGRDAADVFPVRLYGSGRVREQSIEVTTVTNDDEPGVS